MMIEDRYRWTSDTAECNLMRQFCIKAIMRNAALNVTIERIGEPTAAVTMPIAAAISNGFD